MRAIRALCLLCLITQIQLAAQTFKVLASFDGTNGTLPSAPLVQGLDGNFYSTTSGGSGTVFRVTSMGALTTLYRFPGLYGNPTSPLLLATDGSFYGTVTYGGTFGGGTIFKITASPKTVTTLYNFCSQANCADGQNPWAGLIEAADGNFYGTTRIGGASGNGTVFKITPSGAFSTLYSFCSQANCADGQYPYAGLIQAKDGLLYGTTSAGGTGVCGVGSCGTVFSVTTSGALTTLYNFCSNPSSCPGGANPVAGLVQGRDGNFYGTTLDYGGGYGTVFKLTSGGTLRVLHVFRGGDGAGPWGTLIQATDGNFYGTTKQGGNTGGNGTVFEITPDGVYTVLHSLTCSDGTDPFSGLVQGTDGTFYGTASDATTFCASGTVFNLSVGLAPFVETIPTSGNVGSKVTILGTELTGATNVTFNGVTTAFVVVSGSQVEASVPAGATTGLVQVTTSSGMLSSNAVFNVR